MKVRNREQFRSREGRDVQDLLARLLVWTVLFFLSTSGWACRKGGVPRLDLRPTYRTLAVLPVSTSDSPRGNRALAAAELVVVSLESRQPAVFVRNLESLVVQAGSEGRCLAEPDYEEECASRLYSGARLLVSAGPQHIGLTLFPGADSAPRILPSVYLEQDILDLGSDLVTLLELPLAPEPQKPADAAKPLSGLCLTSVALESFGRGLRARLMTLLRQPPQAENGASDYAEARKSLEKARAISPSLLPGAYLAQLALENTRAREALDLLPEPLPAECGLGKALAARGRAVGLLGNELEAAADLARSVRQRPFNCDLLAEWAEALRRTDRLEEAALVLRRLLLIEPSKLGPRRRLSELLDELGKRQEARSVLIEGLEHARAPAPQATLELDLGRLDEEDSAWKRAALHYQRGTELIMPVEAPALRARLLNGMGVAFCALEQYGHAEDVLEEALQLKRDLADSGGAGTTDGLATTLYNLGIVQARQGRWSAAEASLKESATAYGNEEGTSSWLDLARLQQQAGLAREAIRVLKELRQEKLPISPPLEAQWHYLLGLALNDSGDVASALVHLRTSAVSYGSDGLNLEAGLAWFNLGSVAQRVGQTAEAMEAYEQARAAALAIGDMESVVDIDARLEQLEPKEHP